MDVVVVGTDGDGVVFDELQAINQRHALSLDLSFHTLPKPNDKFLLAFTKEVTDKAVLAIVKGVPTLVKISDGHLMKSYLNWQSLTKRIVSAGRKSELILQACKVTSQMSVIDGTAGFGHDSLIMASTGAQVIMIEQNPLVALLLHHEYHKMQQNQNWQKLLARIQIRHGDFLDVTLMNELPKVDVVYLDPMFPADSYSAKVNKNMQVLHELAAPPDSHTELLLLQQARQQCQDLGKVIVKRPVSAPYLANQTPAQSVANDAIRFDKYE